MSLPHSKVRRVTELLRLGGYAKPMPFLDPAHLKRGQLFHEWTTRYEQDASAPDPEIAGAFCEAFRRFARAMPRREWRHVEQRLTSEPLQLTGQPDRYGLFNGHLTVVDWKTGLEAPWHALQLWLYTMLLTQTGCAVERRVVVYFRKDGAFRIRRCDQSVDAMKAHQLITDHLHGRFQ